jgi:hypothetical protein
MPQVDYSHIPFNETAETRRRPQDNNQQTRLDSIIEDITRSRQNRPRIDRTDVFRSGPNTCIVNSDERSFIQTHPILFGIELLILTIAIISSLLSRRNFPISPFIANSKPVDQAMPVQSLPEPITTVPNATDVSQADNSEVNSQTNQVGEENAPYQDTKPQQLTTEDEQNETQAGNSMGTESETTQNQDTEPMETTADDRQNEIQSRNSMNTERETTQNGEKVTQPKGNQPQWMTVPPRVFFRARYVRQPNQFYKRH